MYDDGVPSRLTSLVEERTLSSLPIISKLHFKPIDCGNSSFIDEWQLERSGSSIRYRSDLSL